MIATRWPRATWAPFSTSKANTLPCIGASTSPLLSWSPASARPGSRRLTLVCRPRRSTKTAFESAIATASGAGPTPSTDSLGPLAVYTTSATADSPSASMGNVSCRVPDIWNASATSQGDCVSSVVSSGGSDAGTWSRASSNWAPNAAAPRSSPWGTAPNSARFPSMKPVSTSPFRTGVARQSAMRNAILLRGPATIVRSSAAASRSKASSLVCPRPISFAIIGS